MPVDTEMEANPDETGNTTISGDEESQQDSEIETEIDEDDGRQRTQAQQALHGMDDDHDGNDNENEMLDLPELPDDVMYRRMPCMAHSLQLVIKQAYNKNYSNGIMKARKVVGNIRKSSKLVGNLVAKCGKNVVADNITRWNSTFMMGKRLLQIKVIVNEVLGENGIDTLLVSEWTKLEEMCNLLEPFATQTDLLQTDVLSLSYVLPSILELECHLLTFPAANSLVTSMLADLRKRFSSVLNPLCQQFNPLPAAACLLDNTMAAVMLSPDMEHLLEAAKSYLIGQV